MRYFSVLFFIPLLFSCTPKSELLNKTNCTTVLPNNTEIVSDFKKNFTIAVPKNWKKKLFYNNTESSIFFADTTKQLNETYIIKSSYSYATIKNIETFKHNTDSILNTKNSQKTNDFFFSFNQLPAYAFTTNYKNENRSITSFQMYAIVNNASYISAAVEVYGTNNINNRLCEGISLLNSIKISH